VREFRSRGSVRGAVGNDRPYREHFKRATVTSTLAPRADIWLQHNICPDGPPSEVSGCLMSAIS
jgi:hypothetical protein